MKAMRTTLIHPSSSYKAEIEKLDGAKLAAGDTGPQAVIEAIDRGIDPDLALSIAAANG
jgi:hypothetical protein